MKIVKTVLIITPLCLLLFTGCSKDSSPTETPQQEEVNKISLNGAGYNNVTMSPYICTGVYNSSTNKTGLVFQGVIEADTVMFLLWFPGQTTGTFPWQTADNYAWFFNNSTSIIYYNSVNSGSTTVTSYGDVGQNIEGNCSGKLNDHSAPYDTINVSCNKFSVSRSH